MKADLHIHTVLSDGKNTASEIIRALSKIVPIRDKFYISFTDHHYLAQRRVRELKNITVIPGIEISSTLNGHSFHLTAYSLEPKIAPDFELWLRKIRDGYQKRAKKIYNKIIKNGFNIGPFSYIRKGGLPQPVYNYDLALRLKRILKFSSEHEVLGWSKENGNLLWIEEKNFLPSPGVAIRKLHNAGFRVFLAHPGTRFFKDKNDGKIFEALLLKLKKDGLDGIEAFNPTHTRLQTLLFEKYAKSLKLVLSGGSDYHGKGRGQKSPVFILPETYISRFIDLLNRRST